MNNNDIMPTGFSNRALTLEVVQNLTLEAQKLVSTAVSISIQALETDDTEGAQIEAKLRAAKEQLWQIWEDLNVARGIGD